MFLRDRVEERVAPPCAALLRRKCEDEFGEWLFSGEYVWPTGHAEKWDGGGGRRLCVGPGHTEKWDGGGGWRGCVGATGHTEPLNGGLRRR